MDDKDKELLASGVAERRASSFEKMRVDPSFQEFVRMPRDLTDKQADVALAATAKFLDIKGSQLTVNREKMKARYRALVKFIEAAK